MRTFENQEERNQYDLDNLLKLVNGQNSVYTITFDEDRRELKYRRVYGLNDISEQTIKLTEKDMNSQITLKLIELILLRFSLLKRKTRENINERLIDEYISTLTTNRRPLDIMDEIDKKRLLERVKESKDDITHFVDSEIATRVILATLENISVTSIASLIDQSISKYLLAYTFIAPFVYSYVPYKIDKIKNKIKYNKIVDTLENEEDKPKPNLKMFCIVNRKVHELEAEDSKFYATEIKALQEIMEHCYTNGCLEEEVIDLNIIKQIEEVYSRIELKKLNRKTLSFTEYFPSKQLEEEKEEEKKVASK